jgi:hypothetical protein
LRPRHDWYTEKYDGICRTYVASITSLGLGNVSKLEAMLRISQKFVNDQVHLTNDSSETYVNGLLFNSDSIFTAELVNLEVGTSKKPDRLIQKVVKGKLEVEFEKNVRNLDKKINELNQEMFRRRFQDSLVMARMREEIDTISNINKEDKIKISGMTSETPKPTGKVEAKDWLKDIVSKILNSIEPGISSEIIFISQGRSNNKEIPLAEVRMSSREVAMRIRRNFAHKKNLG